MIAEDEGPPTQLPERFGPFILAKLIHRGGMGELFFARSSFENFPVVVVKRLRPDLGGIVPLERFKHEAELSVRLQHPNVVQSLHAGEVGSRRYLAFEPIVGRSVAQISDRLVERRMAVQARFVARMMVDVLSALAYLHTACDERGEHLSLLHRDITPGNVLIGYDGEVKVTDLGVARSLMSVGLGLTQPGTVVGTPAYVAPEFLRGEKLGPPVDIYGLGGVAYRWLTGRSPFPGSARVVVMKAMGQTPRPAAELRPDAPKWLTDLIDRMLAHEPAKRPQDASELKLMLSRVAESVNCLASSTQLGRWLSRQFEEEKSVDEATVRAVALIDLQSISPKMEPTIVLAQSGSAPHILPKIPERKKAVPVSEPAAPPRAPSRMGKIAGVVGAIALGVVLGLASSSAVALERWRRFDSVSERLDRAAVKLAGAPPSRALELLHRADRAFARGDYARAEAWVEELERQLDEELR
jgi:serine/threonine-protein kinase